MFDMNVDICPTQPVGTAAGVLKSKMTNIRIGVAIHFQGIDPKNVVKYACVVLKLVPLRGGNKLEPRPQNEILAPIRGF